MRPETKKGVNSLVVRAVIIAVAFVVALAVLLILRHPLFISADVQERALLRLSSTAFSNGAAIPPTFTCDGADVSPAVQWGAAPAATKSFVLILHDPDAPIDFTHWLAYNIPASVHEIAEGASTNGAMPHGSAEGINDFHKLGYGGPCPPPGRPHHYTFLVYALNAKLNLPAGATREQLESSIHRHIVAEGQLVGLYQRAGE